MNKVYLVYIEKKVMEHYQWVIGSIFANLKDAEGYVDDNKYMYVCNIQEWEVK